MTSDNTGGGAFPARDNDTGYNSYGMSLLDYFAGLAMQSLISRPDYVFKGTAKEAYEIANAMLSEKADREFETAHDGDGNAFPIPKPQDRQHPYESKEYKDYTDSLPF